MKDTFSKLHPVICFTYFAFVIGFSMFIMNPVCIAIALFCSAVNAVYLNGNKAVKLSLVYLLPMILSVIIINPLFNHRGKTILGYFPWGNPLTLESIAYGIAAAVLLSSTILWFSCFNSIITSDKLVYLFGRIIPSLSLVLSMALRFVPKFSAQMKAVRTAQKTIGRDITNGKLIARIKNGIRILSVMISLSLENAIDTADSMKSRGYGLKGRTAYSKYRFEKRDIIIFLSVIFLGFFSLILIIFYNPDFRYFPEIKGNLLSVNSLLMYITYTALMLLPIILDIAEGAKWKYTQSKI